MSVQGIMLNSNPSSKGTLFFSNYLENQLVHGSTFVPITHIQQMYNNS